MRELVADILRLIANYLNRGSPSTAIVSSPVTYENQFPVTFENPFTGTVTVGGFGRVWEPPDYYNHVAGGD